MVVFRFRCRQCSYALSVVLLMGLWSYIGWRQQSVTPRTSKTASKHVTAQLTNASSKSSVSRVLVVAYYRSGSSWLGEALALPDDAFYLFEPYHALYSAWYSAPGHTEVRYTLGGSERTLPSGEQSLVAQSLVSMFDCDFDALPGHFFTGMFFWSRQHRSTAQYVTCMKQRGVDYGQWRACFSITSNVCPSSVFQHSETAALCHAATTLVTRSIVERNVTTSVRSGDAATSYVRMFEEYKTCIERLTEKVRVCVALLRDSCMKASVRVIKTIRLTMDSAEDAITMMKERDEERGDLGKVKVVHLVRDPRAMFSSRKAIEGSIVDGESASLCARMSDDLRVARQLGSDTVVRVHYEDLAASPLTLLNQLYSFLGNQSPSSLATWVQRHSQASISSGPYGTMRERSSVHVNSWRNSSYSDALHQLFRSSRNCTEVMKLFNYTT